MAELSAASMVDQLVVLRVVKKDFPLAVMLVVMMAGLKAAMKVDHLVGM